MEETSRFKFSNLLINLKVVKSKCNAGFGLSF